MTSFIKFVLIASAVCSIQAKTYQFDTEIEYPIIEDAPTTQCTLGGMDLVFVVDESGSIGSNNFQLALNNLATMVDTSMTIGPLDQDSHIGFVEFNDQAYLVFNLQQYLSNADVVSAIQGVGYTGGGTNIADGLDMAINQVFGGLGDRPDAPNAILLVTDGQDGNTDQVASLQQLAASRNITIYALGVGNQVDISELVAATGSISRVYNATDFAAIASITNKICQTIASVAPPVVEPTPAPNQPTLPPRGSTFETCSSNISNLWIDMVFVVDSTKGVDELGFNGLKGAIIGFLQTGFKLGRSRDRYTRIAVVDMGSKATVFADLHAWTNVNTAIKQIEQQLLYKSDTTPNIYDGLNQASQILDNANGNANRKKVIYIFSSGNDVNCNQENTFAEDKNPCRLAETIKNEGKMIVTFSLKFNNDNNVTLSNLGSPCSNYYNDRSIIKDMMTSALYANCFCSIPTKQFMDESKCLKSAECLYLHDTPSGWTTATTVCTFDDPSSRLADIRNKEKNMFFRGISDQGANGYPVIFGLGDPTNSGSLSWQTNAPFYGYTNYPGNNGPNFSNGKCAQMQKDGTWIFKACSPFLDASSFMCQQRACDADNYCA
uniref:VWFA domain-containing protein n=1 Tax=Rhabditophanes sp. KR3021 TaxID=114890 RepID=A0AC35TXK6_9BILA